MASSSSKKSTGKKKTGSNKKRSGSKKKNNQLNLYDLIHTKEAGASIVFLIGLFLFLLMILSGGEGSVYNSIHLIYFDITGLSGVFLPFIFIFFGVVNALNKNKVKYYVKAAEMIILTVIVSSVLFVTAAATENINIQTAVNELFVLHYGISTGGLFGTLLGGALFMLTKSKIVSVVVLVLLGLIDIMLMFSITFYGLLIKLEKPAKKVSQYTGEQLEKRRSDYDNYKVIKAKERAAREEKRAETKKDVSLAVNDFYSEKKKNKKEINTEKKELPVAEQPSMFEQDYSNIPLFNNSAEESEVIKSDTAAEKQEIHTDIVNTEDAINIIPAEKDAEKEKVMPLSEEEKEVLNAELDDGLKEQVKPEYKKPPLDCLNLPKINGKSYNEAELKLNGDKLIAALNSFNVSASIVDVVPGPTVTRYELSPAPGVKISKFVGLSDDLALHMAAPAGLRIEAPIPNKAAIGIEIPNRNKTTVTFREIIDVEPFKNAKSKLNVALGKNISGDPVYSDLAKMPHLLVAGTTGSGKSVCLNTMIVSLLYNATPDEVKILLIDPKQVEFGVYNNLPHLLVPVVSDPRKASGALAWAVTEMLNRYKTLNANGVRDISAYNSLCEEREDLEKMPQIVIFIDELSDLMTVAPAEVEDSIQRLAQMARAAGMHLVVATQRPSVDVITGVIKANIPSRIALTVKSQIDSRTIIDAAGAEKLMGNGDMLYYPVGVPKPIRVQGSYLTDSEIENVVNYIKSNGTANYDDNVQQEIEKQAAQEKKKASGDDVASAVNANDDLLSRAIELFVGTPEKASISALQRHLGLGFAKAGRLMDTLEEKGIVGPHEGSKPRKVLITKAQWYEMNAMSDNNSTAEDNAEVTENDVG